jgi:hypothetical protein
MANIVFGSLGEIATAMPSPPIRWFHFVHDTDPPGAKRGWNWMVPLSMVAPSITFGSVWETARSSTSADTRPLLIGVTLSRRYSGDHG